MKRRKDGRWRRLITINGKQIPFYSKAATERQAERDILLQIAEYKEKEERGKTVKQIAEEWSDEHFKTITYSTAYRYDVYKNKFLDEYGNQYIKQITALDIESFLFRLVSEGFATKTIKDQLSVIKMIFRYAIINRYIKDDVSFYVRPPKGAKSQKREALTNEQIEIINNSTECTFGLLAYFLLYTGLRKGEALALRWKDVDMKNHIIHVSQSVYFVSNEPHIKEPKTQSGTRDVIIPDCLAEKLHPQKATDYVFNKNGKLIDKSFFTRQWEKYTEETGLNITAHQLRHTYATLLFEANIDEKDAQFLMGHSDIKVTQNIYTHIRQSRTKATANKLNNYFSSFMVQDSENP